MIEITDEQREVLKLAIEICGEENQIDKAIEEMAELTQALLKYRHERKSPSEIYANVVEEIADVRIMIEQMAIIHVDGAVKEKVDYKIDRLAQRLHGEV